MKISLTNGLFHASLIIGMPKFMEISTYEPGKIAIYEDYSPMKICSFTVLSNGILKSQKVGRS